MTVNINCITNCCPSVENCPPDDFSDDFGTDDPAWGDGVDPTTYSVTGGQLVIEEGLRKICREWPANGTIAVQVTAVTTPGNLLVSENPAGATTPVRTAELVGSLDFGGFYQFQWHTGSTLASDTISVVPDDGDVLKIEMDIVSDVIVEYRAYINGNLELTQNTGVAKSTDTGEGDAFGGWYGMGEGTYDDFSYVVTEP